MSSVWETCVCFWRHTRDMISPLYLPAGHWSPPSGSPSPEPASAPPPASSSPAPPSAQTPRWWSSRCWRERSSPPPAAQNTSAHGDLESRGYRAGESRTPHLLLVFLELFLQFLGFALGVFEFLAHLHVLQVQLGKLLLLALYELGQLGQFPFEEERARHLSTTDLI